MPDITQIQVGNTTYTIKDSTAQTAAEAAQVTADEVAAALAAKITYGTTDLTAGSSPLATGTVYLVYE